MLLTEYQVAQQYVDMLEKARWNATAVIIGSLVIGGTVATVWRTPGPATSPIPTDYANAGAAVIAILIGVFWWGAMNTWRIYQDVAFRRMRDIESTLGMKKNLMVHETGQHLTRVHTNLGRILLTVSIGWFAILLVSIVNICRSF